MADMNIPNSKSQKIEPGKIHGQQNPCPICMDDTKYEVETNCGHKFCCQCWITYVAHFSSLRAISCPYCTQKVKILYQCFSDAELNPPRNSKNVGEVDKFLHKIKLYNLRKSGEPRTTHTSDSDSDSENYTDVDSDDDSDNYTDIDTDTDSTDTSDSESTDSESTDNDSTDSESTDSDTDIDSDDDSNNYTDVDTDSDSYDVIESDSDIVFAIQFRF